MRKQCNGRISHLQIFIFFSVGCNQSIVIQEAEPYQLEVNKMNTRKSKNGQRGFTLIEILIVVIIIGLIASLVAPNLIGRYERAKEEIAKAQVEMLSSGVMSFKLDMNRYPTGFEELVKGTDTKWRGPYLSKQTIPKDPWGQDYQYKTLGDHGPFDIYSLGVGGKFDDRSAKNW